MSKQSNKNQYSGTEPEKTKKLFVQCFKEQTDKQFIVDGTEWRFAEPGIGHSKDGPHMTLIMSGALDALLVQQASHKHKGMIETGEIHCRTGMDLCDLNSRVTEKLDHMLEWSQKEAWICNTLLGAVILGTLPSKDTTKQSWLSTQGKEFPRNSHLCGVS